MSHRHRLQRLMVISLLAASVLGSAACSRLERLTMVRPSADRGKFTQVAPTYDVSGKASKSASKLPPAQLLAAATALYTAGQLDDAGSKARQVLKADPASSEAHTLLGLIASGSGQAAIAGVHYQKALEIAPGRGAYANNYGIWLCSNGRAQESLAWFDTALADTSYSTPVVALANAGACAQQSRQLALAESYWRKALALDPESASALSGMAALHYASGEYLDARAFVQRWLAIAPQDVPGLRLAVQIEEKQGDNLAAQGYRLRLQAIAPAASLVPSKQ